MHTREITAPGRPRCTTKTNFDSHDADQIAPVRLNHNNLCAVMMARSAPVYLFIFFCRATKTIWRKSQVNWAINFIFHFNGFIEWFCVFGTQALHVRMKWAPKRSDLEPVIHRCASLLRPLTDGTLVSIITADFNMQTHQQVDRLLQKEKKKKMPHENGGARDTTFWCIYF